MTDTPLIDIPEDPNAPKLIELGEDGDEIVIQNTRDPELARRMIVEYWRKVYDETTLAESLASLDEATFTIGEYWWHEPPAWGETILNDITETPLPTVFPGVRVRFSMGPL